MNDPGPSGGSRITLNDVCAGVTSGIVAFVMGQDIVVKWWRTEAAKQMRDVTVEQKADDVSQ